MPSGDLPAARADLAKAVAHPLRATVLEALNGVERSPQELAKELGEPLANVAYHVGRLRDLGGIQLTRTAPRRGATEHFYTARWQVDIRGQLLPECGFG